MDRKPKQTFLQQAHVKMLNITNYQRNASQKHNEGQKYNKLGF